MSTYFNVENFAMMPMLRTLPDIVRESGRVVVSSNRGTLVISMNGNEIMYEASSNDGSFANISGSSMLSNDLRNNLAQIASQLLDTWGGKISSALPERGSRRRSRDFSGSLPITDPYMGMTSPTGFTGEGAMNTAWGMNRMASDTFSRSGSAATSTGMLGSGGTVGTIGGMNNGGTFGLAQGGGDIPLGLGTDLRGQPFEGRELAARYDDTDFGSIGFGYADQIPPDDSEGSYDGNYGGARRQTVKCNGTGAYNRNDSCRANLTKQEKRVSFGAGTVGVARR